MLPSEFLASNKITQTRMSNSINMSSLLGTSATDIYSAPMRWEYTYSRNAREATEPTKMKRLVTVVIVDPHPEIPAEKSLLYQSTSPVLTDLNDEELFLEIPIRELLQKHNEYRVTVDEAGKVSLGGNEYLSQKIKPAKLRDLKKQVITLASF